MTGEQYEQYISFYRKHPQWIPVLKLSNKFLTLLGYLTYIYYLASLWIKQEYYTLLIYIILPGISFLSVSIYRKIKNKPRPYEQPDIQALCPRKKSGQSFPSRHVFSFALISALVFSFSSILGGILLLAAGFMAYIRVILGIHYPIDVFVGYLLGIFCGAITVISTLL